MTPIALGSLIIICSFVWGGFLGLLIRAFRRERAKGVARSRRS